jgi:uncharacterized protein (TIGR02996 family)
VSDGDILLAAILAADPADDAPRLVYADWLDEHAGDGACPEPGCGNPARGWNGFYQCRTCKGRGVVPNGNAERAEFIRVQPRVSACSGTGRTPGLAAVLAGRQPVTGVVLTDREPAQSNQHPGLWRWYADPRPPMDPDEIPDELFALLDGDFPDGAKVPYYPSAAAAHAALSAACVAYLRASSRDRARSAAQNPA